jgi:DNA transformation protein
MAISDEYINYVIEQLECIGTVISKKMFGGAGLYFEGIIFGLIADDVLYFKVDDSNRADYEEAGMVPFKPFGDKSYAMQYYEVPVEVLEDPDILKSWINKSLIVAHKSTSKKRIKKVTPRK